MNPFRYLPLVVCAAAGLLMHAPAARAECVHGLQGHSVVWGAPGSRSVTSVEDLLATLVPEADSQDRPGRQPDPSEGPCLKCHQHPIPTAPRQSRDPTASGDPWMEMQAQPACGVCCALPGSDSSLYRNPILDRPEPPPRAAR